MSAENVIGRSVSAPPRQQVRVVAQSARLTDSDFYHISCFLLTIPCAQFELVTSRLVKCHGRSWIAQCRERSRPRATKFAPVHLKFSALGHTVVGDDTSERDCFRR